MFRWHFRPALVGALANYRRGDFFADLSAGVTVAFVALPLAMAFGIASGVKPEQGLITSIIGGVLVALLGGSRVQIAGPAGAFIALLYAIVLQYGVANLLLATMMAGVLLFAMGALRLGSIIRFIPVAVVVGFTNGIAVIIGLQQVRDFLGLEIEKMPANFFSMIATFADAIQTVHWPAVVTGAVSLAIVAFWPRASGAHLPAWRRAMAQLPGTIVVLVLGALAVAFLEIPVETIGSRFGGIPQGFPPVRLPEFDWTGAQNMAGPAIAIALLGAIESLLCARVADKIIGGRHDSNQELMAQGVANFVTPLFGGIAVTGTVARTVTNVRAGARTPMAGVFHAATLLAIMLVLAPYAAHVPMATLAAILLHVAWNMGDWGAFPRLRLFSVSHRVLMVTTFLLTVIFDLTVAVQVGLVLASLFFIYRVSALTRVEEISLDPALTKATDQGIRAYRLFGSLFFGSVGKIDSLQTPFDPVPGITILEMHQVISLDTTGLEALEGLLHSLRLGKGRLIIAAATEQPLSLMQRSGFIGKLGPDSVYPDLAAALAALREQAAAPAGAEDPPEAAPPAAADTPPEPPTGR